MKKSSFFIAVSVMTLALVVAVVGITAAWFGDTFDYRDGPINVSSANPKNNAIIVPGSSSELPTGESAILAPARLKYGYGLSDVDGSGGYEDLDVLDSTHPALEKIATQGSKRYFVGFPNYEDHDVVRAYNKVKSILDAVDKVNAENIFVLPNNKNIIMAANQAAELTTDKHLLVIPTKTIPQGITAVINYVEELSIEDNEATMLEEIRKVKTGQVTYAVRDTMIDDKEIHQDDFMGLGDAGLHSVGRDMKQVTMEMVDAMVDDDSELISIYYGSDVTEDDAQVICDELSAKYPNCDVELQFGGQPIYYYVISVE